MNDRTSQPFFKNVLMLIVGGSTAQVLGFLVIILLGQRLGARLFGELSFAQAALIYLTLLADPGLKIMGTRRVAGVGGIDDDAVRSVWSSRIILALIIVIIWSIILYFIPISSPRNWLLWGYSLSLIPMAISPEWIFTGKEKLGPVATSRLVRSIIHLGLVYLLVRSTSDWGWAPALYVASLFFASIYLIFMGWKQTMLPDFQVKRQVYPEVLKQALPLGISAAMIQVYYYLDSLLLGIFRTSEELGYYSAAYKVILFLLAIADTFATVLLPTLTRLAAESHDRLCIALREIVRLHLWIGVGFTIGVLCLARDTLSFLFGQAYLPGANAMMILSGTLLTVFGNLAFGVTLIALHREKKYTLAVTAGAVLSLALNLILIPLFGIIGAASATVASETIVWGFYLYFLRSEQIHIPWSGLMVRLLLPTALMAYALSAFQIHVIYKAILGAVVYLLFTWITGIWSIKWLRHLSLLLGFSKSPELGTNE